MQNELEMPKTEMPALESALRNEPEVEKISEYRPSNQEALREYEIRIRFLHKGCIVSVGCKEIAFEEVSGAMAAINAYVKNPWEQQKISRKILD